MRGAINVAEAYARGKMLNHSGLATHLPRGISPSDIDMVCDNNGRILFIELSSKTARWDELAVGQRRLYESIVSNSRRQRAVLCHVRTEPGKEILTDEDVIAFSVMSLEPDTPLRSGGVVTSKVFDGSLWIPYLRKFYGASNSFL